MKWNTYQLRFLLFFCCLLVGKNRSQASSVHLAPPIDSLKNPLKTQYFQGRMDDFNPVLLTLKCGSSDCEGELTFLQSKTTFEIYGTIDGEDVWLSEFDAEGNETGMLKGRLVGGQLELDWSNYNNTIGSAMVLLEKQRPTPIPRPCDDNKWIHSFKSEIGELILQRAGNYQLQGMLFLNETKQSYPLKGELNNAKEFEIFVKNSFGEQAGILRGELSNHIQFEATLALKNEEEQAVFFKFSDYLTIDCAAHSDYTSSYDFLKIKSKNKAFNDWLTAQQKAWLINYQQYVENVKKDVENVPQYRLRHRASAWCEIEYWSPHLISGYLHFTSSWEDAHKAIPFVFDLQKNRLLETGKIFAKDFDYQQVVQSFARNEYSKNKHYLVDDNYKKWVQNTSFDNITFRKEGICFSTETNMLYGRQSVIIPYADFGKNLRVENY